MSKMDLDPQMMMIRAIDKISAGWVQGKIHGSKNAFGSPEQDLTGVCLMGAIQDAVDTTILEEFKRLVPMPEGVTEREYDFQLKDAVRSVSGPIQSRLIKHLGDCVPGGNVPGYNDTKNRTKEEVIAALKGLLAVMQSEQEAAIREELRDEGGVLGTIDRVSAEPALIEVKAFNFGEAERKLVRQLLED